MESQDAQQHGDIHIRLNVGQEEALHGGSHTISLPGWRSVTVTIPAGVQDGEEIHLAGLGETTDNDGARGELIVHISLSTALPPSGLVQQVPVVALSEQIPIFFTTEPSFATPTEQFPFTPVPSEQFIFPIRTEPSSCVVTEQCLPGWGAAYQPIAVPALPPEPPQTPPLVTHKQILLTIVALFVLLISCLLAYDFAYYQPHQHLAAANANATSNAMANAQATSTASSFGTQVAFGQTADAQAQMAPYVQATSGRPLLDDSFSQPDPAGWPEFTTTDGSSCAFKNGRYSSYEVAAHYFLPCIENNINFRNLAFQVDMTLLKGDLGGLIIDANQNASAFYILEVNPVGGMTLSLFHNTPKPDFNLLMTSTNAALAVTPGQALQITLIASKGTIDVYVDQQLIDSTQDTRLTSGQIGVFAEDIAKPTAVAFSHLKVWKL